MAAVGLVALSDLADHLSSTAISAAENQGSPMFKTGRYIRLTILAVILCAVTGCLSPLTTRLPMFANDDLRRERRGFEFHDPLPDPNIGPELGLRPPDFNRPRSQARQAAEQRILFGLPFAPESIPAGSRQGGLSRPNAL